MSLQENDYLCYDFIDNNSHRPDIVYSVCSVRGNQITQVYMLAFAEIVQPEFRVVALTSLPERVVSLFRSADTPNI